MKKVSAVAAAAFTVLLLTGLPGESQAQLSLGINGGYDVDVEELLIGANARIPIRAAQINGVPLLISPGFEYYPFFGPDAAGTSGSFFLFNVDLQYPIRAKGLEPYVGAGLLLRRVSVDLGAPFGSTGDTDVGLNLAGGALFGRPGSVRPFGEAAIRIAGGSSFVLKGGVYFRIGR